MIPNLSKKITNRFKFYLNPSSFDCNNGWFNILWQLSESIEKTNDLSLEFKIIQVKKKNGALRLQTNFLTNEISNLIVQAAEKSETTCELCGKPGELFKTSWIKARCEDCYTGNTPPCYFIFKNTLINYHPSWHDFFISTQPILTEIEQLINDDYTPATPDIFRFAKMNLEKIKYIILGEDPYPQPNVATGRAFEVNNINSWNNPINMSLANILKLIHKNTLCLPLAKSIKDVRDDISTGRFDILPPDKLFKNWEQQGVLLLNTALTCKIKQSSSHTHIWQPFTQKLLALISKTNPAANWYLWGNKAIAMLPSKNTNTIKSYHPSARNSSSPKSFLFSQSFISQDINWTGK